MCGRSMVNVIIKIHRILAIKFWKYFLLIKFESYIVPKYGRYPIRNFFLHYSFIINFHMPI